jgi:hypothetical protein
MRSLAPCRTFARGRGANQGTGMGERAYRRGKDSMTDAVASVRRADARFEPVSSARPISPSPWRSLRGPSGRVITWAISISAVLHLAFTPLAGLIGLMSSLLAAPAPPEVEAEQLRSIPITLLSDSELAELDGPAEAVAAAPAALVPPLEQSAPQPAPKPAPPKPAAAPAPAPPRPPEKPTPAPAARGAAPEGIGHPVAMTGLASEVVDSNANVNLLLVTERLRQHPLGPRIGRLIVNFPQWSSFFESGAVDPVRDIDRMLVVGPQFRRSADVVAIIEHSVPREIMRGAVDRLVQRPPKGRWLRAKFPVARAHADRAERVFALTAPHVLVVAPTQLEPQILASPPTAFPAPAGDEALVLHVKTPWRALIGLPFRLPESLEWLRLDVVPLADGGAQIHISAQDADARQAAEHAQSLSIALNALTNPDLGALGALVGLRSIAFIDKITFQARGERISGQVRVSPRQLERLMVYAEELAASWTGRRVDGQRLAPQPGVLGAAGASARGQGGGDRRATPSEPAPSAPTTPR